VIRAVRANMIIRAFTGIRAIKIERTRLGILAFLRILGIRRGVVLEGLYGISSILGILGF
jgi:hypothetical protein